jgi:hypothetical protein
LSNIVPLKPLRFSKRLRIIYSDTSREKRMC